MKINLDELIDNKYQEVKQLCGLNPIDPKYKKVYKELMLDFGQKLLELAAEDANMICSHYKGDYFVTDAALDDYTDIKVNKQSILDVINKIK